MSFCKNPCKECEDLKKLKEDLGKVEWSIPGSYDDLFRILLDNGYEINIEIVHKDFPND